KIMHTLEGSCIRQDRAENDGTKKQDQSLIAQEKPLLSVELNIFGRDISYRVLFKMHIDFQIFPVIKKILSLRKHAYSNM
ncbi:MAG: hypothetical protein N0C90_23075, partial [Candidatus Thiodiazotropha endolucinida]|nr:hypothetical protein [Candidatus Thiodiazotropha taylori]MCW4264238.1 hypothetical protein [Candidatus Thiodiazotropha endolucinida]